MSYVVFCDLEIKRPGVTKTRNRGNAKSTTASEIYFSLSVAFKMKIDNFDALFMLSLLFSMKCGH